MHIIISYITGFLLLCPGLWGQNNTSPEIQVTAEGRKADSLDLLARKYMLLGKKDSAKILLDKATAIAIEINEPVIIARCYVDYAHFYNLRSDFVSAQKYIDMARPYLAVIDHYEIRIAGILLMAGIQNMTGRKDSAIYYYQKAEAYNQQTKNYYRNYLVYLSMGEMYNQLGDFAEAEANMDKAYRLTAAKDGKPDHGYVLLIYINYHLTQNKAEGAGKLIAEYTALMEERKKTGFNDPLKNVLSNVTIGRIENNVEFMKQVRDETIRNKEHLQTIIADVYISRYYEKKKGYDEALKYITEAEQLAATSRSVSHLFEVRKIKFGLQRKAGQQELAAETASSLFDLKDSMLTLEKRQQVYELEKKYETEKKQKEIELLASQKELSDKTIALLTSDKKLASLLLQQELLQNKSLNTENQLMDSIVKSEKAFSLAVNNEKQKQELLNAALDRENKLKAGQLRKERYTKWILAGGAALLLLSGAAILFLYRKQRHKNIIIQKQAADLEVLMKEIHHRVKNNLQIVSSLLDLQSHYITDSQASEAVKEGKNRIQSMALIHQNLYSEGNIKGILVKDYISNLLQTLCSSYNISNDKIQISVDIDNLSLDVDTMIPLGLVINELVSNSFKYAFHQKQTGELEIVLKEDTQKLHLMVKDNGSGFPEGLDVKNSKSFGLKMIRAFAQKLKAKLSIYNNNGAVVEMEISKYKMA